MYVCMYVCIPLHSLFCAIKAHGRLRECMYVCMYTYSLSSLRYQSSRQAAGMHVCIHIHCLSELTTGCGNVCMYVCMCVCTYSSQIKYFALGSGHTIVSQNYCNKMSLSLSLTLRHTFVSRNCGKKMSLSLSPRLRGHMLSMRASCREHTYIHTMNIHTFLFKHAFVACILHVCMYHPMSIHTYIHTCSCSNTLWRRLSHMYVCILP